MSYWQLAACVVGFVVFTFALGMLAGAVMEVGSGRDE